MSGSGSGIIITEDGYIVTNTHVLDGMEKYVVNTYDNKSYTLFRICIVCFLLTSFLVPLNATSST